VGRGELAESLDLEAALDQLLGPVYYRVLVTGEQVGLAFTDLLVDGFLKEHLLGGDANGAPAGTPAGTPSSDPSSNSDQSSSS
jgi:Tetracyclin repressor-like, C-terminal domain